MFLSKKEDYSDWIIITAFYSALHYTRALMIPVIVDGEHIDDFEVLFKKTKRDDDGRHGFQKRYVMTHFPEITYEYSRLHDLSITARYSKYNFTRNTSSPSMEKLNTIKRYVESKKIAAK